MEVYAFFGIMGNTDIISVNRFGIEDIKKVSFHRRNKKASIDEAFEICSGGGI